MPSRNPIAQIVGKCVAVEPLARQTGEVWAHNVIVDQGRGVTARCTAFPEVLPEPQSLMGQDVELDVELSARSYAKEGQQRAALNLDVVSVRVLAGGKN